MPNPMDWKQALAMLIPATAAGLQGGGAGLGGFATGYGRGRGVYDEMQNRQGYLDLAQQREAFDQSQAGLVNQQRAEEQKRQELGDLLRVLQAAPEWATTAVEQGMTSGAADPADYGAKQFEEMMGALSQASPLIAKNRAAVKLAAGDFGGLATSAKLRRYKPIYDRMTKEAGADDAHYQQLLQSPRQIIEGMTFGDLDTMMRGFGQGFVPKVEKPEAVNSLEALLARAVAKNDPKETARIRGEIAQGKTGTATEPGTWSDTGRVNDKNESLYINTKTLQVKPMPFGAKPKVADDSEAMRKRTVVVDSTNNALNALDELLDEQGVLRPEMTGAIGASRYTGIQKLKGSEAYNAQAKIDRLRAVLVTDLMAKLKAQSRTGATGFGQLNLQELKIIQDAAAKLDPGQSEAAFQKELGKIRAKLEKILQEPTPVAPGAAPGKNKDPLGIL